LPESAEHKETPAPAPDAAVAAAAPRPTLGPGAMLRRARADSGLSQEDVAAKLHLGTRQVLALEHDDYSVLPGPTYVRGYLRSYADLVGIDPKTVLDAHTRLAPPRPAPDFHAIAPERELTTENRQIQTITWGVIAAVIGLALAWWLGGGEGGRQPAMSPAPAVPPPAAAPLSELPPQPEAPAETLLAPGMPGAADVAAPPAATTTPEAPTGSAPESEPGIAIAPVTPLAPAPAVGATSSMTPIATVSGLVIRTSQESWVDVRDAEDRKLVYDMVPAGRTIRAEGKTPIKVFIGNAPGVQLEWNGAPFDFTRYQRGNTARFAVGKAAER
jgi:cytoskeleton protein RodZ